MWTEVAGGGGAPNFLTGIGGYLQSLIFGYGGIRLLDDKMTLKPTLPKNCSSISIFDLDYLGNHIDIKADAHMVKVEVTHKDESSHPLSMEFDGEVTVLDTGHAVSFPMGQGANIYTDTSNEFH